jgi:hypothetical protein
MSLTNAAETALLTLLFNNTDWANIGDAAGLQNSAAAGSFYVSLHTADPTETGNQTSSEATYTGYARVAVARSGAGWTVSGNNVSNTAAISFGPCTAGTNIITHLGIGTDLSGTGNLVLKAPLTASLSVSSGITPSFAIGELDVNID